MDEFTILSDKYKEQRKIDYNIIYNNLISSIIDMFEFTGFPESVRPDMLIRYMFSNGICAIPLDVKNPPVCICSLGGDIDPYGYGRDVLAVTQHGTSYTGKMGVTMAVFKNNTYLYPEFYILQTAKILTELYTSMRCNIVNARLAPIGKARTDSQRAAIEKAFEEIYKGKPYTVKSGDMFTEGEQLVELFTDPRNAQYIPYLSQLEDDIIQKFYYHYGINMNNVNKRAQVTSEEVTGADPLVWTIPLQKLNELKKGCEMMRSVYPDADVNFGGIWKKEYEKYNREVVNNETDKNGNNQGNISGTDSEQ